MLEPFSQTKVFEKDELRIESDGEHWAGGVSKTILKTDSRFRRGSMSFENVDQQSLAYASVPLDFIPHQQSSPQLPDHADHAHHNAMDRGTNEDIITNHGGTS